MIKTSDPGDLYASPSTLTSLPCQLTSNDRVPVIRKIITKFVEDLEYHSPKGELIKEIRMIYQSLCTKFSAYNNGGEWFQALCLGASTCGKVTDFFQWPSYWIYNGEILQLCYPDHPVEIQLQAARYTWYLISSQIRKFLIIYIYIYIGL